jgi:hypothetical protein
MYIKNRRIVHVQTPPSRSASYASMANIIEFVCVCVRAQSAVQRLTYVYATCRRRRPLILDAPGLLEVLSRHLHLARRPPHARRALVEGRRGGAVHARASPAAKRHTHGAHVTFSLFISHYLMVSLLCCEGRRRQTRPHHVWNPGKAGVYTT